MEQPTGIGSRQWAVMIVAVFAIVALGFWAAATGWIVAWFFWLVVGLLVLLARRNHVRRSG